MPHYTDKDMTYEEFSKLLKERFEKGESTDDYSYKSNITMTIEELITQEEKELTNLSLRHNEIVEYQNENPSFYHDDEELDELWNKITEKEDFVVQLKRKLK